MSQSELLKACSICGKAQPAEEYYPRGGGRTDREVRCRTCCARQSKEWRAADPERTRLHMQRTLNKRRKVVNDFKNRPCEDCKGRFPLPAMHLDHVRGEKVASLSYLVSSAGIPRIKAELEKCEVRCANCHAIRHHVKAEDDGLLNCEHTTTKEVTTHGK